jgi:nucleoside-diphosphate-sugar epimerase
MTDDELSEILVEGSTTLKTAMNRIDRAGTGMVVVVEGGRLRGTATDGDVRRSILSGATLDTPVREVMTEDPVYLRRDWSSERIAEYLEGVSVDDLVPEHRMLLAPVVDADDRVVDVAYVTHDGDVSGTLLDTLPAKGATHEPARISGGNGVSTVLVIGGAGYIGSVLSRKLLEQGYRVRVLDNLTYGDHGIADLYSHDRFRFVEGDMRSIEAIMEGIRGADALIHLGALVGDPASAIDPQKTLEVNYHAVRLAASICKYHQVNRFIFASTCSVYGESERPDDVLTERSPLNPVSLYAKSKIESERALLELEDENFSPTIFRMATVYGLSPRMRFDLVVNVLSAKAYTEGVVPIFGGDQYRPNVHVADAAQAYVDCLETPIETVSGETYNVGSNEQNYRILEVGEIVESCFPGAEIDRQPERTDERTYQVDFSKAREQLGFEAGHTIADCCRELRRAFDEGRFQDFTATKYNNYETLQEDSSIFDEGGTGTPESTST